METPARRVFSCVPLNGRYEEVCESRPSDRFWPARDTRRRLTHDPFETYDPPGSRRSELPERTFQESGLVCEASAD
jgi:hypothetical protein